MSSIYLARTLSTVAGFALFAGVCSAQANPNAIAMWRSDKFPTTVFYINNIAAGGTGNHVWCVLPPDVLTYFKPQTSHGVRELDFRGFSMFVGLPANPGTTTKACTSPMIELRKAKQAAAPNEGRWVPDTSIPAYVTFAEVPNSFNVAANVLTYGLSMTTRTLATPVKVPAGTAAGDGLCLRWVDYMKQYGTWVAGPSGNVLASLMLAFTSGESSATTMGLTGQTVGGVDTCIAFGGTGASTEGCMTFYFDQSLIMPVKNVQQLAAGAAIPGGVLPAAVSNAFLMDDGRGALNPSPGDVISFSVNSNKVASLGPTQAGNVFAVPFVLFSGDIGGGNDPLPENWVGSGGVAQPSYIHQMPLQRWFEDLASSFGLAPGLGAVLNQNNSTLGLWLGLDLTNGLISFPVLLNSFALSDLSSGFPGPEVPVYDKLTNATGVFGRNIAQWNANYTGELRTLQRVQHGYTPPVPVAGTSNCGIVQYPSNAPTLAGQAFYITCWLLDTASPVAQTPFNIIDMTNVIKISL